MIIKNRDELLSHGDREGRAIVLDIIEGGLAAADPYVNTQRLIRLKGDKLLIGGQSEMNVSGFPDEVIDLREVEHIYVLGAGKAVQRQAKAFEDLLGDRLTGGAITIKRGEPIELERIEVTEAAHPVPDEGSVIGAEKLVRLANRATDRDLVFTIFSDGASSLAVLPMPGLTLEDIRQAYFLAIKYGSQGIIHQVMRYCCGIKSGRITQRIHPARMVHLIMQVGLFPRWHGVIPEAGSWVPTWPPARRHMPEATAKTKAEPWWDELPPNVRHALEACAEPYEVPDLETFRSMRFSYWQPIDLEQMLQGAKRAAEKLGLQGVILSSYLAAHSSAAATVLSQIAHECEIQGQPFRPPVALITGGHLDVPVGDAVGIGGRNQEFALLWARALGEGRLASRRITVGAVDSDGTDGPGSQHAAAGAEPVCMAGGIVDGYTLEEATASKVDMDAELANHNSTMVLMALKSAIYTGNTGTCLGDLRVAAVR